MADETAGDSIAVFDAYVIVDWSAAAEPKQGADSIWIGIAERHPWGTPSVRVINPPTRHAAAAFLADLLSDYVARDRVVFAGFDFAFGFPAGFAGLLRAGADWRTVWKELAARISDGPDNANNRFDVAAALNRRVSGGPFPFWSCPRGATMADLAAKKPRSFGQESLPEFRLTDTVVRGPKSVWQLLGAGSVGGQTLVGIAHLERLRRHPWLGDAVRVWPFETGLGYLSRPGEGDWRVLFAEIYPAMFDCSVKPGEVLDAVQVRELAERFAYLDAGGDFAGWFAGPEHVTEEKRRRITSEEGWILGVDAKAADIRLQKKYARFVWEPGDIVFLDEEREKRARPAAKASVARRYDYIADPDEIYRRSFALVQAEADLSAVPGDATDLAVRLIHACGDPSIAGDLAFGGAPVAAARTALRQGAPVLVDSEMVAAGIIRARLPADNPVICTLNEVAARQQARRGGTTRSAAAVELWQPHLAGAVVAIGNAPTALFRLLELIDAGGPRPAVILAFPVGFVGAAESKAALIDHPGGLDFVTLRGRRGGSAMASAAVNALAGALEGSLP